MEAVKKRVERGSTRLHPCAYKVIAVLERQRFQHRAWARPGLESALERSQPRCRADGDARALGTIACVGRLGTGPSDTGHG
jgi:hypothetical protein